MVLMRWLKEGRRGQWQGEGGNASRGLERSGARQLIKTLQNKNCTGRRAAGHARTHACTQADSPAQQRQHPPTWQAWQAPLQEVPERLPRHVVVGAVAVHKVHGHIQHVFNVPLKSKAGLKHKGQRAAAAEGSKAGQGRWVSGGRRGGSAEGGTEGGGRAGPVWCGRVYLAGCGAPR